MAWFIFDTQEDNTEGCYVLSEYQQAFWVYACKIRTFSDKCCSNICKFFFRIEMIMQKERKKVKKWTLRSILHKKNSKYCSSKFVIFNYNFLFLPLWVKYYMDIIILIRLTLYNFYFFVKNQVYVGVWIYVWVCDLIPLIHLPVLWQCHTVSITIAL